jgi:hypothetical protein
MIPRRASCRQTRNSSKSVVANQHRTSMSRDVGPRARNLATTTSGQSFGSARSARSNALEHPPDLRLGGAVREADHRGEADAVPRGEGLDPRVRELAVRDRDERPVECADLRRPQADPLHGAGEVVDLHGIADAQRLVGGDRQRAEDVLDRLLRPEGHGDAADPEAGEDQYNTHPPGGQGEGARSRR